MIYNNSVSLNSTDKQKEHFDKVAPKYQATIDVEKYQIDYEIIRHYTKLNNGDKVLDLATGTGKIAIGLLLAIKNLTVYGLDISPGMLHSAQKRAYELGLSDSYHLVQGDLVNLEFPNESFNLVLIGYAFHHIPIEKRITVLQEANRVLKKDGKIAILEVGKRHFIEAIDKYCENEELILKQRMEEKDVEFLLRIACFDIIAQLTRFEHRKFLFSYIKDYLEVQGISVISDRVNTIPDEEKLAITEHRFICIGAKGRYF